MPRKRPSAGGCPVAVEAYPGHTADPATVADAAGKLRQRFGLERVVLVGDRGLLTQARIEDLRRHPGLGWVSVSMANENPTLLANENPTVRA